MLEIMHVILEVLTSHAMSMNELVADDHSLGHSISLVTLAWHYHHSQYISVVPRKYARPSHGHAYLRITTLVEAAGNIPNYLIALLFVTYNSSYGNAEKMGHPTDARYLHTVLSSTITETQGHVESLSSHHETIALI